MPAFGSVLGPAAAASEAEHLKHFMRERFHSEPEAASFIGGPSGSAAVLNYEEFARALRLSGYGRPAEPLFSRFSRGGDTVTVRDVLRDCGLPSDPTAGASSFMMLAADHGLGPDARAELRELRGEVAALRQRIRDGGQSAGDVREMRLRVEEALQKEAGVLRADGLDLRASLTEALRLLDEERRERQGHAAEHQRCINELQRWTEERLERVEQLAREGRRSSSDIRAAVQEALQLGELSEVRALGAVAEESRTREANLAKEYQNREALASELEHRCRRLLSEERAARVGDTEELARHVGRLEEAICSERDSNARRLTDLTSRLAEVVREVQDESSFRQADVAHLSGHGEQLEGGILELRAACRDEQAVARRCAELERSVGTLLERVDHEFFTLKDTVADMKKAAQGERAGREERVAQLQRAVDAEARERQEAVATLARCQDTSDGQLEQHLKALILDDRATRDELCLRLEKQVVALQEDLRLEVSRSAAHIRELSQAVVGMRDSVGQESIARRQEIANIAKSSDDACYALRDGEARRERMETRLIDQVAELQAALREEALVREDADRQAAAEAGALRSALQRESVLREDLASLVQRGFSEEGRRREEAWTQVASRHDDTLSGRVAALEGLLRSEQETRDQADAKLAARLARATGALDEERQDRDERQQAVGQRLLELEGELLDARDRGRECLARFEEAVMMKDAFLRDRQERQAWDAGLELAVKEQGIRVDKLQQAAELRERSLDRALVDLGDRIEQEQKQRAHGDADIVRQLQARREEMLQSMAAERRKVEEVVAKADEAFQCLALDEQNQRQQAVADLEKRCLQLRETMDEALKWRIEQYNELVLEMSKLSEALTDESKTRQREQGSLEASLARLRTELEEEANGRRLAVDDLRDALGGSLRRLERGRESATEQQRERASTVEQLRLELSGENSRLGSALEQLRQELGREVLARDELLAGVRHSLKSGLAKAGEEWRAACRTEGTAREEAQLRMEKQLVDLRGGMQELRLAAEQREQDVSQRLKAAAEALSVEYQARRELEAFFQRSAEEIRRGLAGEGSERRELAAQISSRLQGFEEGLQEEAACREDLERRVSKELIEFQGVMSDERGVREGLELRLEQLLSDTPALQQEALLRESRVRDDAIAAIQAAAQRAAQAELAAREELRRDIGLKLQQLRADVQTEVECRSRLARELAGTVARVQRLQVEEEEARSQECERLSVSVESLQESLRALSASKEATVEGYLEAVDQLRSELHKQIVSHSTKEDLLEAGLRELRAVLRDEAQARERELRALADAFGEERTFREAALGRERRVTEEELARAQQLLRKTREEEDRRLQERLLEVMAAVSEERDQRLEALRQERQRSADVQELAVREQKATQRELGKLAQALQKSLDEEAKRVRNSDALWAEAAARTEDCRNGLAAEAQQRDVEVRTLEQRAVDLEATLRAEIKERRDVCVELKKGLEAESTVREEAVAAERRAREAADAAVEDHARGTGREERSAREAAVSQVSQDVLMLKSHVIDEIARHDEERSGLTDALQRLRSDVAEILGERKVDGAAQRDSLEHLRAEVAALGGSRREALERQDAVIASLASRVEQCSRACRDQSVAVEQALHGLQAELLRECDERSAAVRRLDARVAEERRIFDGALSAEAREREEVGKAAEEVVRRMLAEEARKTKITLDKLAAQLVALSDDALKLRSAGPDQARDVAKDLANFQRQLAAEEQSRQLNLAAAQRAVAAVRDELLAEAKERRGQQAAALEELANLRRALQQREDRGEGQLLQLGAELAEVRERVVREARARDVALAQVEQQLAALKGLCESGGGGASGGGRAAGVLAALAELPAVAASVPGLSVERWRQLEDDLERTRLSVVTLQGETYSLSKALVNCEERCDAMRASMGSVQVSLSDSSQRQRSAFDVEQAFSAAREELRKECADRRAETGQLAARAAELGERLELVEQQRLKAEQGLRQELIDVKAGLKREGGERERLEQRAAVLIREEAARREEGLDREVMARKIGEERLAEGLAAALREERRLREREVLRLEDRGPAKGDLPEAASLEVRGLRQALVTLQDRIGAAETRQKSAEERTVNMLDAIMGGLAGPQQY